jgi:hypothetical protein
VLEESRGTLHPQHAIRFAAMKGAADAAKGLGDTEAAIRHARAALECIQVHLRSTGNAPFPLTNVFRPAEVPHSNPKKLHTRTV